MAGGVRAMDTRYNGYTAILRQNIHALTLQLEELKELRERLKGAEARESNCAPQKNPIDFLELVVQRRSSY